MDINGKEQEQNLGKIPDGAKETLEKRIILSPSVQKALRFGWLIEAARIGQKLSTKELSKIAGCSKEYIRKIEAGEINAPGFPLVVKLTETLNLDSSEIIKIFNTNVEPIEICVGFSSQLFKEFYDKSDSRMKKRIEKFLLNKVYDEKLKPR